MLSSWGNFFQFSVSASLCPFFVIMVVPKYVRKRINKKVFGKIDEIFEKLDKNLNSLENTTFGNFYKFRKLQNNCVPTALLIFVAYLKRTWKFAQKLWQRSQEVVNVFEKNNKNFVSWKTKKLKGVVPARAW